MAFSELSTAVAQHFQTMVPTGLYRVAIGQDDSAVLPEGQQRQPSLLWTTYLQSFPAGTNPRYLTRTEHDCSCCRAFIREMGGIVTLRHGTLVTLWDVQVNASYQPVVDALADLVRTTAARDGITDVYLATVPRIGVAMTRQQLPSGLVKTWEHFCVSMPTHLCVHKDDHSRAVAEVRTSQTLFLRALTELTTDALEVVLDLMDQNTLYRGTEHQGAVQALASHKRAFDAFATPQARSLYCWEHARTTPVAVTRMRNTALGTLLVDLSQGRELEEAVRAYERITAPTHYQRPTALVSKKQIAHAQAQVEALGLLPALERRYAVIEDITINNVLWADRSATQAMQGVFEALAEAVPMPTHALKKAQEMPIEHFLTEVLPQATGLEVLVENRHAGNLVSLIAPVEADAPRLFQWDNGFSWTYAGDLADSMKERVKRAGGKVDGDFRASLSWFNHDDLDLHLHEPTGCEIYYAQKRAPSGGALDVDMNAGRGHTRTPVENIVYATRRQMRDGTYTLEVHQFQQRESTNTGFEAEIEFNGQVYAFAYDKPVRHKERVMVARFHYSQKDGLVLQESLPHATTSRTVWGVQTQTMRKAHVVMLSPNYWDAQAHGNKHYFFMLEGCQRDGTARGFLNEYLRAELREHRQVLERVGARMHTEEAARQLSGLGFSSTMRNTLMCRVAGASTRLFTVTF